MTIIKKKMNTDIIARNINSITQKYPGLNHVILSDMYTEMQMIWPFIDCSKESTELLKQYDFSQTIFIYACEQDDIGLPFIEFIIDHGGVFEPVFCAEPSNYVNTNHVAREVLEKEFIYQTTNRFAKWDFGYGDFANITQVLEITRTMKGPFVEIGCFNGSSSCVAMKYLYDANINRNCYFFDVFDGFVYESAHTSADRIWSGTHQSHGIDAVKYRLSRFHAPERGLSVTVEKLNIITDELPKNVEQIAVANIDVDMYEAVLASLNKLAPLMAKSGIIIVEDPGHTPGLIGARVALERFLRNNCNFMPLYMESGQTLLISI
jgi:hypothetical protein